MQKKTLSSHHSTPSQHFIGRDSFHFPVFVLTWSWANLPRKSIWSAQDLQPHTRHSSAVLTVMSQRVITPINFENNLTLFADMISSFFLLKHHQPAMSRLPKHGSAVICLAQAAGTAQLHWPHLLILCGASHSLGCYCSAGSSSQSPPE